MTLEQVASRHGVQPQEVRRWRECYLDGARDGAHGILKRRSVSLRSLTMVGACVGALWATSVAADHLPLITFSPGAPAKASDVNANFSAIATAIHTNRDKNVSQDTALTTVQTDLNNAKVNRSGDTMTGRLILPAPDVTVGAGGGLQLGTGGTTLRIDANEVDSTGRLYINEASKAGVTVGQNLQVRGNMQVDGGYLTYNGGGGGFTVLSNERRVDTNYASCGSGRVVTAVSHYICDGDQLCTRVRYR